MAAAIGQWQRPAMSDDALVQGHKIYLLPAPKGILRQTGRRVSFQHLVPLIPEVFSCDATCTFFIRLLSLYYT